MPDVVDLFGFGQDPEDFEERATCNCGALEPGASGIHNIDCATYDKGAVASKDCPAAARERLKDLKPGIESILREHAKREARKTLADAANALNPGRKTFGEAAQQRRAYARKLFRVAKYDPKTGLCEDITPWEGDNVSVLKAELMLAYRIIALLVEQNEQYTVGGHKRLLPADMRRAIGKEPMLATLLMNFSKSPEGHDILELMVNSATQQTD